MGVYLEKYFAQARRIAQHREEGAERIIRKMYKHMYKDLQAFVSETYVQYAEDDKLTFAMLQKAGYDARFLEEIEQHINVTTPKTSQELRALVEETYRIAYEGMVKSVAQAGVNGLDAAFAEHMAITPEQIKRAVENPVSGLTLKDTLEKNRKEIIYSIKQAVGIGLMNGDRYSTMARRIAEVVDSDYKKAIRIARTEAHRVREAGNHDAAMGVDQALQNGTTGMRMVKTWRSMQDERVRPQRRRKGRRGWSSKMGSGPNHMILDGQTVLVDEMFDLMDGHKSPAPGLCRIAGHDINCRCYVSYEMLDAAEYFAKTGKRFSGWKEATGNIAKAGRVEANGLFVNKSEALFRNAKNVRPIEGYEDFTCHADPDNFLIDMKGEGNDEDFFTLTPEQYAEAIKRSNTYKGGNIRILSCQAGAKEDGAAQRLADALGVDVYAPTEIVNIAENGEIFLSDSDVLADLWYNADDRSKIKESGKWVLFHPRKG